VAFDALYTWSSYVSWSLFGMYLYIGIFDGVSLHSLLSQFPAKWHDATLQALTEYPEVSGFDEEANVPLQVELPKSAAANAKRPSRSKLQATKAPHGNFMLFEFNV